MLEKLPAVVGRGLRRVRPGLGRVVAQRPGIITAPSSIHVISPAFLDHDTIPVRYTADGEGISPPLRWYGAPEATRSIAVIVEDADSPTPAPLVHAIVGDLAPVLGDLEEGELIAHNGGPHLGKNSYLRPGWLPPDPPPGHGPHRYVFQLFALDYEPSLGARPGRHALIRALQGHTIARGMLVGTYSR